MTDPDLPGRWDEAAAAAARQGVCPVCQVGGWASLAKHVAAKHGIRARELKALLGIPVSHGLDSPEVEAHKREIRTAMGAPPGLLAAGRTSDRGNPRRRDEQAEQQAAAGRTGKAHGLQQARRASADARRKIPLEDLPSIRRRRAAGEYVTEIAATYAVAPASIHRFLREHPEPASPAGSTADPSTPSPDERLDAAAARAEVVAAVSAASRAGLSRKELVEIVKAHGPRRAPRPSRDELARLLDAAGSASALARELGVSSATAGKWCRDLGLSLPRKAPPPRRRGSSPGRVAPHGTPARYNNAGCRCERCRAANTARHAKAVADRAARRIQIDGRLVAAHLPAQAHGTNTAYNYWSCRCPACSAGAARRMKRSRRRHQ